MVNPNTRPILGPKTPTLGGGFQQQPQVPGVGPFGPQGGLFGSANQGTPAQVVGGQGQIGGGGLPPTAAPPVPNFQNPAPGMSGITPGAVERRLGGNMSIPPTAQANPMQAGLPPTQQAQMALGDNPGQGINGMGRPQMALGGNTVGANASSLTDPVALIRAFLQRQQ